MFAYYIEFEAAPLQSSAAFTFYEEVKSSGFNQLEHWHNATESFLQKEINSISWT